MSTGINFWKISLYISVLIGILNITADKSFAGHGSNTLSVMANNYAITLQPDVQGIIEPGQPVTFSFSLQDTQTGNDVNFTSVSIKIWNSGKALFEDRATNTSSSPAVSTFTFPKKGNYDITVVYYEGDKDLIMASLPITIGTISTTSYINIQNIMYGITGLSILALIIAVIYEKLKKRKRI